MSGSLFMSWLVTPALMTAVFLGCGLLVRRLGGGSVPPIFVLPLGFALVLVVGGVATSLDVTSGLGGYAFLALAAAGLVLERRTLLSFLGRPRAWIWPAAAAFAAFAVIAAPLVLSGSASYTGYARIVDIPHQFELSAYLLDHGRTAITTSDSSATEVVRKVLGAGYPGGWQSALASFGKLLSTDLAWLYQPLLALTSAMLALAVFGLLRGLVRWVPLRALAAGVAAQANVLYAYGSAGGFKELAAAAVIVLTAGLLHSLTRDRSLTARDAVPLGTAIAGCMASFSLGALPWLGVILAGTLATTLLGRAARARSLAAWGATAAFVVVVSLPTLAQVSKAADVAGRAEGSGRTAIVDLGNLAAPVPVRAAAGTWITSDYRVPAVTSQPISDLLVVFVVVLACVGIAYAVRRREHGLVLAAIAAAIALAYYSSRTGPWIELKAIAITGPVALACAFAGAAAVASLGRGRRAGFARLFGSLLAAGLAVAVLAGNAIAYHNASIAPVERLRELERIGNRYAGQGPALFNSFDEIGEYFLRRERAVGLVDPPAGRAVEVRAGVAREGIQYSWDLDSLEPSYVQSFPLLILRRSPLQSRPPANYSLAQRTRYYEVWRKVRPRRSVVFHVPASGTGDRRPARACGAFERLARGARRDARVAYAEAPTVAVWRLSKAPSDHSPKWGPGPAPPAPPQTLVVAGPGYARALLRIETPGEYRVWMGGSFGRRFRLSLDGRPLGSVANRRNYPEQFEPLGVRRLDAGSHRVRAERGGGDLWPGSSSGEQAPVGPLVLERLTPHAGEVRYAPLGRAGSICRSPRPLDWLEIVR
jgi:hypothetical protein